MARTAHRRHVRARQPAAAPNMAGAAVRAAGASISRADELRDGTARPRRRTRLGRTHRHRRTGRPALDATPICWPKPIASRTCSSTTCGSFRAIACCCAAPNSPAMAACWFAVIKAGGIAVATMPLLRARELTDVITKAQISHALCDARLADELERCAGRLSDAAGSRVLRFARRRRRRGARTPQACRRSRTSTRRPTTRH